jgi:hypothetical protein
MQKAKSIGDSATEFGSAAWNTAKNFNFSTETIDQARGFYLKQSIAGKKEGGLGGFVKQGFGAVGVNLVEMGRKTPDIAANARDFVMNWDTDAYAQDAQKSYSTQIKQGQQTGGVLGLGQQVMGYGGMAVSSLPWVTKQIEPLIERGVDFVADGQVKLDKMLLAKAKGMPIVEPLLKTTLKSWENDVQFRGGVTKGLGTLVGGTLNMLTHPVETVKGIEALMEHVPLVAILPVLSPSLAAPLMMQGLPELVRKDAGKGKNPMPLSSVLMMNPLKTERMMWESMMKGQDPRAAMRESMDPDKNLSEDGKFWSTLGSAFIKPYQKAIDEGKPMEAVGRGAFEVATLLLGGAEAKAGKVATEGATVAKTVGKVGEGAQTANKVTEVAQTANKVSEGAEVLSATQRTTETANVTNKSGGIAEKTGQSDKVTSGVQKSNKSTAKVGKEEGTTQKRLNEAADSQPSVTTQNATVGAKKKNRGSSKKKASKKASPKPVQTVATPEHSQRLSNAIELGKKGSRQDAIQELKQLKADLGPEQYEALTKTYLDSIEKGSALKGVWPKAGERITDRKGHKIDSSGSRNAEVIGSQGEWNCIPQTSRSTARAATGKTFSEQEAIQIAKDQTSFYHPEEGMYPAEAYKINDFMGVESYPELNSPNMIRQAVEQGRGTQAMVDAGMLWGVDEWMGGHAIEVIRVVRNKKGRVTHYVINDMAEEVGGAALQKPAQLFEDALLPSKNSPHLTPEDVPATITENPISYGGSKVRKSREDSARKDSVPTISHQQHKALQNIVKDEARLSRLLDKVPDPLELKSLLIKTNNPALLERLLMVSKHQHLGPRAIHDLYKTLGSDVGKYLENLMPFWDSSKLGAEKAYSEFSSAFKAAELERIDKGHSIGRHGPQLPDRKLEERLTKGITPDDGVLRNSPPASTRFSSYGDWVKTREAALTQIEIYYGVNLKKAPPVGTSGEYSLVTEFNKAIDEGFMGVGTKETVLNPATGTNMQNSNGGNLKIYPSTNAVDGITRTRTTVKWNGYQWQVKQHFPEGPGWNDTSKTYNSSAIVHVVGVDLP